MHADEVETDTAMVRSLLTSQFPRWANLPIERVASTGTDNAIYRLGTELVVRMPRIHWATSQIETERHWLPLLRAHLPLELPEQLAAGVPDDTYPYEWAVYRWLDGEDANHVRPADMNSGRERPGRVRG